MASFLTRSWQAAGLRLSSIRGLESGNVHKPSRGSVCHRLENTYEYLLRIPLNKYIFILLRDLLQAAHRCPPPIYKDSNHLVPPLIVPDTTCSTVVLVPVWSGRVVIVVIQRFRQLIGVLHLGIRVVRARRDALFLVQMFPLSIEHAVICTNRDAPRSPLRTAATATPILLAAEPGTALLILVLIGLSRCNTSKDAAQQPRPAQIIRIDDAAAAELHALTCVVHPSKVDVQPRLNDAEDDRDGVWARVGLVETAPEPV